MSEHICRPGQSRPLYDARGIYCCRVCDRCEEEKRARYRPEIFSDAGYDADEPIDEE
jgi:hypothetical protein